MNEFVLRCRRGTALVLSVTILYACGGGGAAIPSAPEGPTGTGGTPPSGTPSTPAQPSTPPPPAAPAAPPPPSTPVPSAATIRTPDRTFSPGTVTIAVNGTVTWQVVEDRHNIIFVGAAPPGGSPGEIEKGGSATRTFTAPGSYDFECERHRDKGMRGTVIVQPAGTVPPPSAPTPTPPPPSGSTATVTTPGETFSPSNVTIAPGGTVTWQFSGARHNVTFQGTAPTGGNVPDQEPGTSASRTFTAAGTYNYSCTRHSGMTGRVTVQ
ncbi:MAG: plastocyanin/azurin family copper-binding protein [Gemmatimonadaceae bacterium]